MGTGTWTRDADIKKVVRYWDDCKNSQTREKLCMGEDRTSRAAPRGLTRGGRMVIMRGKEKKKKKNRVRLGKVLARVL